MTNSDVSRREVLNNIGAGGLGVLAVGTASAGAEPTTYNVGTASPAAERAARDTAAAVSQVFDWGNGRKTVTGRYSEAAIDQLENRPDVRYTEVDGTMHAIDAELDNSWGVDRVDAEVAHANAETGSGGDIAIIDTGIDDNHSDLDANVGAGKAFIECGTRSGGGPPCSTANCNEPWSDDNDHGTHCAGIADAEDDGAGVVGTATDATLHAVKVLDCNGSGSYSDVAAGIKHVADQGWDVGSLSLGGSKSSTVADAVEYAYGNGVLLVAAAGNDGPCTDCVSYPAAEPEVIAVSATTSDDCLADFSSQGPEIELAAPGTDVYSTVIGGYDTFSGTSMACPHVSGAGGLLMADGYSNTEARDQLNATAETVGLADNEQGNGLVDAAAAFGLDSTDSQGSCGGTSDTPPAVDSLSLAETETDDADAEFDAAWDVSDSDGDLETVDLTLRDTDDGETEATTSVAVSGETASGTTRLVASGEDASGHTYAVDCVVTDASGNTDSATAQTTEVEPAPTVDSLSAAEVETSDADAEFDVSWAVSDDDGGDGDSNLEAVDLTLDDTTAGSQDDATTVGVSGGSASDTTRLVAPDDDGTGHSYDVTCLVTDHQGKTDSATVSVTESEGAVSASIDTVSEVNAPSPHAEFEIVWSASDTDGDDDLDSAALTLTDDTGGHTEDSVTEDIGGGSASLTTTLKAKFDEGTAHDYTAELVVTDADGSTGSETASFSEDGV